MVFLSISVIDLALKIKGGRDGGGGGGVVGWVCLEYSTNEIIVGEPK